MSVPLAPTPIVSAQRPIRAKDTRTGATVMLVPSLSRPNLWHRVSSTECDCMGFGFRGRCSHREVARRELAALAESRYCEICCRDERCHCPVTQSWCDRCVPLAARATVPLVARLMA